MTEQEKAVLAMADAVVSALQPFAADGEHALDGVSACVSVICAIAKEYGDGIEHVRKSVLTHAIRELQQEARWTHSPDCASQSSVGGQGLEWIPCDCRK